MLSASTAAQSTSIPCPSCQVCDIQEWLLPSDPDSRVLRRDSLDWIVILKNNQCPFCRLIVRTICQAPGFTEAVAGAQPAEISFVARAVGKVKCTGPTGRSRESGGNTTRSHAGWRLEDSCVVRYVRRIDVSAQLNGRYWTGNIRASGHDAVDEKERLLLARQMPWDQVNVKRIEDWLAGCKAYHGAACLPTAWNDINLAGVRMIDVRTRRVVPAPAGCRYLALSYCWGDPMKTKHLKLTNKTFDRLHSFDELSDDNPIVPSTIRDAIYLTEQLKHQYLWVDAICIIQDDMADKNSQLHLMDRIYKSATITIAAAAGDNAWSGLPGARPGSRKSLQMTETIDGLTLITASKGYIEAIESADWSHRAWILQERNLSPHLLVFTPRQVFWECKKATWCEEVQYECFNPSIQLELDHSLARFKKPALELSPVQRYAFLLAQYTSRKLTNQDDALNAVQGLLNDLQSMFPDGFLWGLPEGIFDTALIWSFGVYQEAPKPRRHNFPSWCWAGWQAATSISIGGPFDAGFQGTNLKSGSFLENIPDMLSVRAEVAWFRIHGTAPTWTVVQNRGISREGSAFHTESMAQWQAQDSETALQDTLHRLERARIPRSHALAFWTQSVLLSVDRTRHEQNLTAMAVRDHAGNDLGHLNVTAEWRGERPDQLPFILVSRNLQWGKPFLDLMCVEWVDGVASRVQVIRNATVTDEVWSSLPIEWRFVILV